MRWAVELAPKADRQLRKTDPPTRLRLLTDLARLGVNPFLAPPAVKKLKGYATATYRFRAGEFRAIFRVEGMTVIIGAVFHRRELEREIGRPGH